MTSRHATFKISTVERSVLMETRISPEENRRNVRGVTDAYLFELTEVFVFTQAFQVSHRLGVVETVLVVDLSVAS